MDNIWRVVLANWVCVQCGWLFPVRVTSPSFARRRHWLIQMYNEKGSCINLWSSVHTIYNHTAFNQFEK